MAYDLEEQEQLATLKDFWKKYGNLITWVLIIALGTYAAYNFWNYYQRKQSAEASNIYEQQRAAIEAGDKARIARTTGDIQDKYGKTAYAQMAALAAAKAAFDGNDLKGAKTQLQWVIDHGNEEYKSIAMLRLSGVLLDEKQFDAALKLLDGEILPQFKAEVSDRKGDVLVAQNKIAEARAAYQAALDAMDESNPGRQLVQLKLDAIGGTPAKAAPAPKAAA
ncbi:MAG TPA: tetratricopeptide repeat protein [Telluria sp.]|nr:tetratricopeptide repeat protein [Telluria sp.]